MLFICMFAACGGGDDADDTALESAAAYCDESPTDVDMDEATSLGVTANDALAIAEGTHDETLVWAEGGKADLTLKVTGEGTASFVRSDAVYPENGTDIGVVCDDYLSLDIELGFNTDDGTFADKWTGVLTTTDGETLQLYLTFDYESVDGTYTFDESEYGDYDDVTHTIAGTFYTSRTEGSLTAQVEGRDDCGSSDCAAWVENVEIGTWGGKME